MIYMSLQKQSFQKIVMEINLREGDEVEIESAFQFSVSYNEDNSACRANIKQVLQHKNDPSQLKIEIEGTGYFTCDGVESKQQEKDAHAMAYALLFPYVQSLIARLTLEAGVPPLMIAAARMDQAEIQFEENEK